MNQTEIIILSRFKTGLVQFIDELVKWMPNDEDLVATRILVQDQIPIEILMKKFHELVYPHAEQIAARDENFFLNDPNVFSKAKDQEKVMSFRKLWLNPNFTFDDKDKAWKWMDFFIKCIKLYLEHQT